MWANLAKSPPWIKNNVTGTNRDNSPNPSSTGNPIHHTSHHDEGLKGKGKGKEMPVLLAPVPRSEPTTSTITSISDSHSSSSTSTSTSISIQPRPIRPVLETSTSQANLLEQSLKEAILQDDLPNLISPPVPARLPSPSASPSHSRPTSRNKSRSNWMTNSRITTPDLEPRKNSNSSSPLKEIRFSQDLSNNADNFDTSSDNLFSSPIVNNPSSTSMSSFSPSSSPTPTPTSSSSSPSRTSKNQSRPSLLSQLSSRSTRTTSNAQFSVFGALITTNTADRNSKQSPSTTIVARPQSTWSPGEFSPSSKRHSRGFDQITRFGAEDEQIRTGDSDWNGHPHHSLALDAGVNGLGLNLNESLVTGNGEVEDKPGFWDTISKKFTSQNDVDHDKVSVQNTNRDENSIEDGKEKDQVETEPTGFLNAITKLRSLINTSNPSTSTNRFDQLDSTQWISDHRDELNLALSQSNRDQDLETQAGTETEGKGRGSSGKDMKSSNLSKPQLLRLQEKYETPKFPVVLLHGLFGFQTLGPKSIPSLTLNYWRGVVEVLEANGAEVLVTEVPAAASIETRATVVRDLIEERFPNRQVNLIAHSMGGLDSRHLISSLKGTYSFKVKSLTTIATPHYGSSFADYMINKVIGKDRLPTLLNVLKTLNVPGGGEAFQQLTRESLLDFNQRNKDDEDCLYLSWGASFKPGFLNEFRIPWGIIKKEEGENDGLVSVSSSKWGKYQGTLEDVSHLHLIGWVNKPLMAALGRDHFSPTDFYLQICEDLAKEGL